MLEKNPNRFDTTPMTRAFLEGNFILLSQLHSKIKMSKRLWTETRQVGAKNSTQKSSKTKAKLSHAEPS